MKFVESSPPITVNNESIKDSLDSSNLSEVTFLDDLEHQHKFKIAPKNSPIEQGKLIFYDQSSSEDVTMLNQNMQTLFSDKERNSVLVIHTGFSNEILCVC